MDGEIRKSKIGGGAKLVGYLAVIAICIVLAHYSPLHDYLTMDGIRSLSTSIGWKGFAVIVTFGVLTPSVFFPRWPVSMACGILYGVWYGFLAGNAISCAGAVVQYFLARKLFAAQARDLAAKTWLGRIRLVPGHHFAALFLLRVFPFSNASATNVLAGTMNVKPGVFVLSTFFGMMPSTLLYVLWGKLLKKPSPEFYALAIGFSLLLAVVTGVAQRKFPAWLGRVSQIRSPTE